MRKKRSKGVTLIELLIAISFVGVTLLLMSSVTTTVLRKTYAYNNGDSQVQSTLCGIANRLFDDTTQAPADMVNIVDNDPSQKDKSKDDYTIAVILPKMLDDDMDDSEKVNNGNDDKIRKNRYIIYFYDRYGIYNGRNFGAVQERDKCGLYVFSIVADSDIFQDTRPNPNRVSDLESLKALIDATAKDTNTHKKKIGSNISYFKASAKKYPLFNYRIVIDYGEGGISEKTIYKRTRDDYTEVFALDFFALACD